MNRLFSILSGLLTPRRERPPQPPAPSPLAWPAGADRKTVFTRIHELNHWGDRESLSGPGSTLAYTRHIRSELPRLWSQLGTRVVLDAPCGDFNWFHAIDRATTPDYVGADIVESLVASNQSRYGDSRTRFVVLDLVTDPLPEADFWLCRDCLFHLPAADVMTVLRKFASSRMAHFCATNHHLCEFNTDVKTGGYRFLNLHLPPYNLGPALATIDDWIEGEAHVPRRLTVWTRAAVAEALGLSSP